MDRSERNLSRLFRPLLRLYFRIASYQKAPREERGFQDPTGNTEIKRRSILTRIHHHFCLAFSLVSSFLPLYYQDRFLLKPNIIQLMGAVQSAGAAIFAIVIGKRAEAQGQRNAIAAGALLAAVGLFGVVMGGSVLFAVPMIFLFGAARAPTYVAYSLLSKRRPGASRAGTFGFYLTIESVGLIVGSYLGGLIYGVSPANLITSGATIFILLAIFSWLKLGTLDQSSGETSKPLDPIQRDTVY